MSPALMGLEQDAVPLGCRWDSSHGGSGSDPWGCCPDAGDRSPPLAAVTAVSHAGVLWWSRDTPVRGAAPSVSGASQPAGFITTKITPVFAVVQRER